MRIAFIGKGGSGKTTISTLFALFLEKNFNGKILFVDADLNRNAASQLGINTTNLKQLSKPENQNLIKDFLIGNRNDIPEKKFFKKSTPPTFGSNLIDIQNLESSILKDFIVSRNNLSLAEVGEYHEDLIAKNCYHGSLSVFENILSHSVDKDSFIVGDMVAGTDSFVSTLFVQFDRLAIVVEPTKNATEVLQQINSLAKSTNTQNKFIVLGNQIENLDDENYIKSKIGDLEYIGSISRSEYIKRAEKDEANGYDINQLEPENQETLNRIYNYIKALDINSNQRLEEVVKIHTKVANDHSGIDKQILINQIHKDFRINE